MTRKEKIAWAAGLFEGEGCITSHAGATKLSPRYLRLALASTDEDVVRQFHEIVGLGSVGGPYGPYKGKTKKPHWQWHAATQKADQALTVLLPYLGERRQAKAEEVRLLVKR